MRIDPFEAEQVIYDSVYLGARYREIKVLRPSSSIRLDSVNAFPWPLVINHWRHLLGSQLGAQHIDYRGRDRGPNGVSTQ